MQPRPSDNQHRPSLPALDASVPYHPAPSLVSDSFLGVTAPVADAVVFGALSRSARIESISRELSSEAWSASRQYLGSQQSRHWWRVDGSHGSIDEAAFSRDQGMPAVAVNSTELDPELQNLLVTQVEIFPAGSSVGEQTELTNGALRSQGSERLQSSLRAESTLLANTPGDLPEIVCGLHGQVSQQILRALGIDASRPATSESPAEREKVGGMAPASDSVNVESESSGTAEIEFDRCAFEGTGDSVDAAEFLHQPEFLHNSQRVTCGPQLSRNLWGGAKDLVQNGNVSFNHVAASDTVTKREVSRSGKDAGRAHLIDTARAFAVPNVLARMTGPLVVIGLNSGDENAFGNSDLCHSGPIKFDLLTFNGLEESRANSSLGASGDVASRDSNEAVVSGHELWHQFWAWTSGRESVRWFVGNLLLIDQGKDGNNALDVLPAVSELLAIGSPCEWTKARTLCGAWVTRCFAQEPVDIHRVVLQIHDCDLAVYGSWVITAPIESSSLVASFGDSISASAAVGTPRFWARVSEFQFSMGSVKFDPRFRVGDFIAFASAHGTAAHLGSRIDSDFHDVFDSTARTLTSIDWVVQRRDLESGQHRVLRHTSGMSLDPVRVGAAIECWRWNAAAGESDLVQSDKIEKAKWQVQRPFLSGSMSDLLDQGMSDDLTHGIRTGPVFRDGVENFQPMGPRNRVSCDLRLGSSGSSMLQVATLDERFLASWSFSKPVAREPDQKVRGRDEGIGKITPINVGVFVSRVSDSVGSYAGMGRQTCGVETMSDEESRERLCRPTMAMRPVESAVTMQAATSFFFRHRGGAAWLTEQFSNVVLQHDSQFVSHHVISCEHSVDTQAEVGVVDSRQVSEANVFHTWDESPEISDPNGQVGFHAIVMSVGCTHACTVAHVPQYLNRAAWCRNVTPLLVAASCRINVAEDFFPPLFSFELPRLVMPVLFLEKGALVACGTMMSGHMHDLPESCWVGNDSLPEDSESRCGVQGTLTQSTGNVSLAQPAVDCPTSPLIRRMRAADSLRIFTDPLRNYLRANWSLSEIFSGSTDHASGTSEAGTRFLVMTDKRSLGYLRHRCGIELVSQVVVESVPSVAMPPAVRELGESSRDDRLTDQSTHQHALLRLGNIKVSLAASLDRGAVSNTAEVGDFDACCSVRFSSLDRRSAIGTPGKVKDGRGTGIVWMPELRRSCAELVSVGLDFERVEETLAGQNVELLSAPVSVQADVNPSPMSFNRPLKFDHVLARKLDCSVVICPVEVHTSLNLSETCRYQECTRSRVDRAA